MKDKPHRVLIVEDSDDDAVLMLNELGRAGHETEHLRVETRGEMRSALLGQSWDVILCDYRLPFFSAPEALKLLEDTGQDLPFILVSGAVGEETAVEVMRAGAHDYLMKNNLARLGLVINREMRDARERGERRRAEAALRLSHQLLLVANRHSKTVPLLQDYVSKVREFCGCEAVGVRLLDKEGRIPFAAHEGFSREFLAAENCLRVDAARCMCAKVFQDATNPTRPFYTNSLSSLRADLPEAEVAEICPACSRLGFESVALIPFRHGNRVLGLILVAESRSDMVPLELVNVLQDSALHLATAIQRVIALQALFKSEETYRTLVETSPDAILQADRRGNILRFNRQAAVLVGGESSELLGKNFFALIDSNDRDRLEKCLQQSPEAGRFGTIEVDFLRTDGTACQGEINAAVVTDADGKPGGFIAVMRDITERKKMQASLIQADRMASLGMLAAGVAHEINNPLSYVLYNAQRLEEDLQKLKNGPDESDPSDILLDCSRQVAEGARRVRDIVRDLKTFACVEEDRRGPTTLLPAIDTAIQLAQNEIKYRAAIVKEYEGTRPVVANQGRLVQVFLNLLINAAQSIDEGDVGNNEIRVRAWSEGKYSLVEVRDTGRGIAPEHLDRLFDPFFTTKPVGVGSGLGLPICHSIIGSLGGSIEATSEPGEGTSMIVSLPAILVEDNPQPEPETQPPGAGKDAGTRVRGRVLIVDDEPMVGVVIRQMLEGEHEVQLAGSGREGIQLLRENPQFDVILCDLIMPDVSGMDVHEWLAERSPELIRRMVFITGGAFTPAAKEFTRKIRNILVDKPIESDALRALVRDLVITNRAETPQGEI